MLHAREDYNQGKMNEIPEDEPVFLLRAQDKTAAATVRYWASLQRPNSSGQSSPLVGMAHDQANRMDAWPEKKEADV